MKLIRPDWSKSTYCPQCDRITIVELDDEHPVCRSCMSESIEAETQHDIAMIREAHKKRLDRLASEEARG